VPDPPTSPRDEWAAHVETFVDDHYGQLRGRVRTHVIDQHLAAHLTAGGRIVDVGGGAGNQSIPLARRGHDVTIADPSPAMLDRARQVLAGEVPEVQARVRLVGCRGEEAPRVLGETFDGVLCHGVVMYVEDPDPFVGALAELAAPGGIVSIVAKNAAVLAARPAQEGRWADALAAFDADRQVNGLGIDTRADRLDDLQAMLARHGVDPLAWYGVRLFTDTWAPDRAPEDPDDLVLAVELEASRRDPYRQLSRLFHLVGTKRGP
jgi:S-adenosylmethionine-dependent methyltransferase